MRRRVPVGDLEIDRRQGLVGERVEVAPLAGDERLDEPFVRGGQDSLGFEERWLRVRTIQVQRRRQADASVPAVDEEPLARHGDGEDHVRSRQRDTGRHPPASSTRVRGHVEADLAEDALQQRIVLEAIATPPTPDQLLLERGRVERDRPAQQDVEVLERQRQRMVLDEGREHVAVGGATAFVSHARAVSLEIVGVGVHGRGEASPAKEILRNRSDQVAKLRARDSLAHRREREGRAWGTREQEAVACGGPKGNPFGHAVTLELRSHLDSAWVREIEQFTGAHRHRNIRLTEAGVLEYYGPQSPALEK
jgi:hypothetical protein